MSTENEPENGTVLASEDLLRIRISELEVSVAEADSMVNSLRWELAQYEREAQKSEDLEKVDIAKKRRADVLKGIESKYEMGVSLSTE